jgi:flavin-dependent dehydrogenase
VVAHYHGVEGVGAHGEMHVFDDGYAGLADVGHGLTNVSIVMPRRLAKRLSADPAAFVAAWLSSRPSLAARFEHAALSGDVRATGPFNSHARSAWSPGTALLGDAADFFDPFTGEGIYAALRGAELLTPYAFDAVRHGAARSRVALAAYDRARREEFGGKWKVERLVGAAVASPVLFNRVAAALAARRDLADLFVGVTGDFVPARRVLRAGVLLRLLLGAWRGTPGRAPASEPPITSHPA